MGTRRFGTCGGLSTEAPVGTCVVASQGSGYIMRNPDSFCSLYDNAGDAQDDPQTYFMSKVHITGIQLVVFSYSIMLIVCVCRYVLPMLH